MVASQNGWSANDSSLIKSYSVVGGKVALRRGDVSVVLLYILNYLHTHVEKAKWPGIWGYAYRPVRGGRSLSNHASGTAIDWNAPDHWLGQEGTFTSGQLKHIRALLNFLEGTVRWGGDYRGRKDEMHFEINKSASAVKRVADKIRALDGGSQSGYGAWSTEPLGERWLSKWDAGDDVKALQEALNADLTEEIGVDGYYGDNTVAQVERFQRKHRLDVDGKAGPQTLTKITEGSVRVELRNLGYDFPLPEGHWFGQGSSSEHQRHNGTRTDEDARHVYRIVRALRMFGHSLPQTSAYHHYVEDEVKRFQRDRRLGDDGVVGPNTWARLDNPRYVTR